MNARHLVPGLGVAVALAGSAAGQNSAPPKRAVCPVDGKAVLVAPQTPIILVNDVPRYFCAPSCRDRFVGWPEKYVKETVNCTVQPNFKGHIQLSRRAEVNNNLYYLCCEPCVGWMREKPHLYLKEVRDPVSGIVFKVTETTPKVLVKGQVFLFEKDETRAAFEKEPARYVVAFRK